MIEVDTRSAPEWESWATLDEDGFLCTLGQISERRAEAYRKRIEIERHIATLLGEKEPWPLRLIHVIVKHIGTEQALAFLHEALEIEQKGGMILPNLKRRRTVGGVFFHLVKTKGPECVRTLGMWKPFPVQKKKAPAVTMPATTKGKRQRTVQS